MLVQQASPEELYATYARNVTTTRSQLKDFSKLYSDDRSRELFRRAEESRAQNNEPIRGWRVTEHEDWLNLRGVESPVDVGANNSDSAVPRIASTEDFGVALGNFKKAHTDMEGSYDDVSQILKVYAMLH